MIARVMVVDDDPTVRRVLAAALARAGFEVSTADDGAPAMKLAEITAPDLIVVDYNMPTAGLVVVRHVKGLFGNSVFCAVLTGEDADDVRVACEAAGADLVMTKPISTAELRRRLAEAAAALAA